MKLIIMAMLLLFATDLAKAQDTLNLSQAIEAALENNHQVKISRIEQDKMENTATRGNAGLLPTLSINSDLTGSYSDLELTPGSFFQNLLRQEDGQSLSPGTILYDGVTATGFNAGIGAQFVIFDGMKGRLRYQMLQAGSVMANLQYQSEMENSILLITRSYIRAVSLQMAITLKELALVQSHDRYRIIEMRREYGQANEQQLLQALVDLKSDSTEYRDLIVKYENAYRDLHTAIGWDNRELFPLDEEFHQTELPVYDEMLNSMLENNTALHVRERRIEQAQLDHKITRSNFMPTLTATAQYGYNYLTASDGQFETQEQLGVMGGISLKIPLFTGGKNRTASQNTKASLRQEQIRYEESEQQLRTQFDNTWQELLYLDNRLHTEKQNLHVYERNFERARDSFERGLITGVELRTAQISLQDARLRLSDTELQMKLAETNLFYLSGVLLMPD